MATKNQQLNVTSFPPGSPRAFIDAILRLVNGTDENGENAESAQQLAQEAKDLAQSATDTNTTQDQEIFEAQQNIQDLEAWQTYTKRQKSEVVYSGISLAIPTTSTNFFTLLNGLTPTSGNPAPFFKLSAGRIQGLNKNLNLNIKFALTGSFAGSPSNRALFFAFNTVVPDVIAINRTTPITTDIINLSHFFAVEEGDDVATTGVTCMVQAVGGVFTATQIKIIATQ